MPDWISYDEFKAVAAQVPVTLTDFSRETHCHERLDSPYR